MVGDTFAHLATLVDGGITTMSSGDNTGIQPPLTLPGSLTVSHGTNVINFAGTAGTRRQPQIHGWLANKEKESSLQ